MAREAKKLSVSRQFWQILIFHGRPASRPDCETQGKKCLHFIEDSERPMQNLHKNALKSAGGVGERFGEILAKCEINCHFSKGRIVKRKTSLSMAIDIGLCLVEPHQFIFLLLKPIKLQCIMSRGSKSLYRGLKRQSCSGFFCFCHKALVNVAGNRSGQVLLILLSNWKSANQRC